MITKFKNWLNKPYYSPINSTYNLIISSAFGLIVTIFLIVFQPFNIHLLGKNVVLFCLGYGLISVLTIVFVLNFLPLIFKNYFEPDTRTILKQLILLNITVLVAASIAYPYNTFVRKSINQVYIAGYFEIVSQAYAVGFFPIIFWLYFDEYEIRRIRKKNSNRINESKGFNKSIANEEEIISLTSEKSNNTIDFDINKLVYISSEGNYASFFIDDNKGLKEVIFRITLSKIEEELNTYKHIVRCHKSYIINTKYISEYSGNARGYLIKTDKTNFDIPVSRRFTKKDLESFLTL